jgi:predicted Holliday junction resolvase-like endonuclease
MSAGLEKIPTKTLNTIQGSVNSTTGKLGELMSFLELQRAYDRLMAVGNIVDFIGIRFPTETDPGAIDFIDVKTGDKAVLNADQKKLRDFINAHKERISFKTVKVSITQ